MINTKAPNRSRSPSPTFCLSQERKRGDTIATRKRKKTWREKIADDKGLPKVIRIEGKLTKRWGTGTMVIPAPCEVDAMIRTIRKGRIATLNDLRTKLAKKHGVNLCCPLTPGIFAWISAHAAAEDEAEGKKRITPWWRVLKSDGKLNLKFPGGVQEQRLRLEAEGIRWPVGRITRLERV